MNREQAKELLPIIQAFAEGKTIEIRSNSKYNPGEWIETATPTFDIKSHEYRIKPGPKYRSFANAEECWQEMKKHEPFGWIKASHEYFNIIGIMNDKINHGTKNNWLDYEYMFNMYKFIDGTAFGIKEE